MSRVAVYGLVTGLIGGVVISQLAIFLISLSENSEEVALPNTAEQHQDMEAYSEETMRLTDEGQYAEALERHLWYHDNALMHDSALTGVRLSFALSNWYELGKKYPPALEALRRVRDEKTALLRSGKGNFELFHDVASINETLEEGDKIVPLFEQLRNNYSKSDTDYYWIIAKDKVIEAERWDLVGEYIMDVEREFRDVEDLYQRHIDLSDKPPFNDGEFREYAEEEFVNQSLTLIKVGVALGDLEGAKQVQTKALAVIDNEQIHAALKP